MEYFGYVRISSKELDKGNDVLDQSKPVTKLLAKHYSSDATIKKHLFYEQYSGLSRKRTQFDKMMKQVKNGDHLIFYKFAQLGRTVGKAYNFINACLNRGIKILVISGNWHFYSFTSISYKHFKSLVNFLHDVNIEKMNEARYQAKLNNNKAQVGGSAPRFLGKKKHYYTKVFKYAQHHSEKQTAKKYNISTRTVARIKRSGETYFNLPKLNQIKK